MSRLYRQSPDVYITEQKISPKEQIIRQGKKVFSAYIIKSGIAKCYLTEDNGQEFIQEFFGEGELFGEIELINRTPSFCCIEAITEVTVYKIGHEHFQEKLTSDKRFNELILQTLATKISYKAHRHAYHQSHTLEDNLQRLIHAYPNLLTTIAKQDIAGYLGVTLRSLNRTIGLLKNKNITG